MQTRLPASGTIKAHRVTALQAMPTKFGVIFSEMAEEIRELNEVELEAHFTRTPLDYALRKRLWQLVEESQGGTDTITVDAWALGLCEPSYIHAKVIYNHYRLSWLFTPLATFHDQYEEMFSILLSKTRKKIKEIDINDDNISAVIKLLENLANRVLGPVPKNFNIKTQNIPGPSESSHGPKDVETKLKELEERRKTTAEIIDVDPE